METEAKYYIPEIEEFRVGFECEYFNRHCKKYIPITIDRSNYSIDDTGEYENDYLFSYRGENKFRVKYLDSEDIESLGFEKSLKNQWIGWNDYYSGNISGEYGYFLYVTLHVPRLYNKSNKLEDNLFKIIVHRYYVSNEDETTNIEEKLKQNESEVIYKGVIKNKSELKQVLKMIGVQ